MSAAATCACAAERELNADTLAGLIDLAWRLADEQAEGEGPDRAADAGRLFMHISSQFEPLREWAEQQPRAALGMLLDRDGVVAERLRAGFQRALEANVPAEVAIDPELVDIAVQAATALEWSQIAIGREPDIDAASRLIRSLFETSASPA